MRRIITALSIVLLFLTGNLLSGSNISPKKTLKTETLLASKKWLCTEVSKKRLTKKLGFELGNELNISIDKKYSFKNNKYDYSKGTWRFDGRYIYFFYQEEETGKKIVTKYKIVKLNESTLILKRTNRPRGKITFK